MGPDHPTNVGLSHVETLFRNFIDDRLSLLFTHFERPHSSITRGWVSHPKRECLYPTQYVTTGTIVSQCYIITYDSHYIL